MQLLLEGGTVVDGTGNPGYRAAIGVQEGRLRVLRGDVTGISADRRIDATGLTITPGFIDMHSHAALTLLADPIHRAKILQGVTTEVIGVDGNSYAPIEDPQDLLRFVRLNSGLEGRPDIPYDWDTVASYLSRFDGRASVNVAYLIGNSALRLSVLGWDEVPADSRAIDRMRALLREGMQEGAFGLSTGLDYPPGSYATTDELGQLGAEASRLGGFYHTHVRYQLGDRYLDPFREALHIGRLGDVPVHLTHLYRRTTSRGGAQPMIDLVEAARSAGQDVTFDSYPYEWSSTRLLILLPLWVQAGGPDRTKERLADPALRDRLRDAVDARGSAYGGGDVWTNVRLGAFRDPENLRYEGRSIADVAMERDQHPADTICDLLVSEDLGVNEVAAGPDAATLPRFVTHPLAMVGTDSVFIGDKPSPRTFGSYPRILGDLVREERLLSLPEAIRKMTSYPAQRLGITDRGILIDGSVADITVFDAARIRSNSTYQDPRRDPEGVRYVIVNGVIVVDQGEPTGATPGRALRRRGCSS